MGILCFAHPARCACMLHRSWLRLLANDTALQFPCFSYHANIGDFRYMSHSSRRGSKRSTKICAAELIYSPGGGQRYMTPEMHRLAACYGQVYAYEWPRVIADLHCRHCSPLDFCE